MKLVFALFFLFTSCSYYQVSESKKTEEPVIFDNLSRLDEQVIVEFHQIFKIGKMKAHFSKQSRSPQGNWALIYVDDLFFPSDFAISQNIDQFAPGSIDLLVELASDKLRTLFICTSKTVCDVFKNELRILGIHSQKFSFKNKDIWMNEYEKKISDPLFVIGSQKSIHELSFGRPELTRSHTMFLYLPLINHKSLVFL